MTQLWTILDAEGAVVQPCCATPDADIHPAQCGQWWELGFEAVPINEAPDLHSYEWQDGGWVLIPAVVRDARWEEAKAYSDQVAAGGFTIAGVGRIQTDVGSREAIRILVDEARDRIAAGETGWSTAFVNEANEQVPVTAAQIVAIYAAVRAFLGACYAARQAARDALDAALAAGATGEDLRVIDITAGYPPST